MPITVTANLLNTGTAQLEAQVVQTGPPPPTAFGFKPTWDIRAVGILGAVHAFYPTAGFRSLTWKYNLPDEASVAIRLDDGLLTELDPDATPTRELQIYRNGKLLYQGKPTVRSVDKTNRVMLFGCKDPTWYLTKRYVGRANRVNRLGNPSFESGALAPWKKTDPDSTLTLTVSTSKHLLGTHALKMVCTDATSAPYVSQRIVSSAGPGSLRLFLTGWFYIETFTGAAPFNAGLLLVRQGATGPRSYTYQQINATSEVGQWVRLETFVRTPPEHTEFVEARLYAIHGTIWWDAIELNADEHLGWGDGTDEGVVIKDVADYLQGKGKFGHLSPEKTDLAIRTIMPTTGEVVQGGLAYHLADHQQGYAGTPSGSGVLDHFLNASNGVDWRFEPQGRILRGHYPGIGVDRTTDVVFTFRRPIGLGGAMNAQWGIVDYTWGDSIEGSANQIVELGGWGGSQYPGDPSREEGGYTDTSELGGVTLELVETAPQGTPISQLNPRAVARGSRLKGALIAPTLIIREEAPVAARGIAYDTEVLLDHPDVFLELDETAGTDAADNSGHGNDWTYSADASGFTVPGLLGDGKDAVAIQNPTIFVASPTDPTYLPPTGMAAYTFELVFKVLAYPASGTDQMMGSVPAAPYFEISDAGVVDWTTDTETVTGPALALGTRHHMAATYDGSHVRLFIDGALVAVTAQTGLDGVNATQLFEVGYDAGGADLNFIAEKFAKYPTALSPARIAVHARAMTGGTGTAPPYPLIGRLLPGDLIAVDLIDGHLFMDGNWRVSQVTLTPDDLLAVTVNPHPGDDFDS